MEININKAELIIDEKYIIKPLMTIEEIENSNLKKIIDKKSKIQLEEDTTYPLFIRRIIDGQEINVKLDITKKRLAGIYITSNPDSISEYYNTDDKGKFAQTNDIQVPQIEGINELEHKKVKELCNIYGRFPSEDNLDESVKGLQNKVKSISDQINNFNQKIINLESVEEANNAIEDIYNKYEESGFDENVLKENLDNIAKYEKVKEELKATDIKDNAEIRKMIEEHKSNIKKLEQTKNNLNVESKQISDSYNAYQKYKDIGTRKLNQLKKELLCNFKAKDELRNVFIHNNYKKIKFFCKEKIQEIDMRIDKLDKEINIIGIMDKNKIDDNIDYIKQKLIDGEKYWQENNLLIDSRKENEIKDIIKNVMEEMEPSVSNKFNAINELYNIENKIAEVEKEIELKEDVIELREEGKILEIVREKLEIIDKYKPIMAIMDDSLNNELFKESYEKKYGKKIKEYNKAKSDLESMEINNWDKYKEAKSIYDKKQKSLLEDKNVSEVTSVDNIKEFEKIVKYKSKQNEIVKKNSNSVNIVTDENIGIGDKFEESRLDEDLLKDNETKNNLNVENNQISDTYSDYKKHEDIGENKLDQLKEDTAENELDQLKEDIDENQLEEDIDEDKLDQLKKELLCNLKGKDELTNIFVHNNDKSTQSFCEEKIKEINMNIEKLDNEINIVGIAYTSEIDDKIDYMKQKLADEKRYLQENDLLNDNDKENEIREIAKNAMKDIDLNIWRELNVISELYNIQNEIIQVEKELELKESVIQLQQEEKRLETAKEKLRIIDDNKYIMDTVNKYNSNNFFQNPYGNQFSKTIKKYNQAKSDLESMEIPDWDKYKEVKSRYDKRKKNLLVDKNGSKATRLDDTKQYQKIVNYKNKQKEIINEYSNLINKVIDQNSGTGSDNVLLKDNENKVAEVQKEGNVADANKGKLKKVTNWFKVKE